MNDIEIIIIWFSFMFSMITLFLILKDKKEEKQGEKK